MNSPEVSRVVAGELSEQRFLADYVALNRPVVVTGALESWDIANKWTPAVLERRFGDQFVQVYNNYFDLQTLTPLSEYFSQYFGTPNREGSRALPYVRWYTKLRDVEFCWADDSFAQLSNQWSLLSFMPDRDYLLPYTSSDTRVSPVTDHFPAKGLFISPRGARTSLHVDPWGSCAVLCQVYGHKRWYLYAPEEEKYLRNHFGVVDVTKPDYNKFPAFERAQLTATCSLAPGEVIYVPHGWYHQVECDTDSISLTWNFVHRTTGESLLQWLEAGALSAFDQSVLRFFYGVSPGADVVAKVMALIRDRSKELSSRRFTPETKEPPLGPA